MSENSSDSDSSCGWTVINHEGSDVETVNSVTASDSCELSPVCSSLEEELPVLQLEQGESSQNSTLLVGEAAYPTLEETKSAIEVQETAAAEDNVYFGTASDDSDIVTLEPPKVEEIGSQDLVAVKEAHSSEDFNMGSSSSSQYTFCQPEAVFSSPPSEDESSSDETSNQPSPAIRRRRGRKKTMSTSEPEQQMLEQENEPSTRQFGSALNKCVILALVIAISMGFGHFYGTNQIQKRQQLQKTYEDEVGGIKDYRQRRQELESLVDSETLRENLMRCWSISEAETIFLETQNSLTAENQHLKLSLVKKEKATAFLQEELRQLREQVRVLEDKGTSAELVRENHSLKQDLEEEKQKIHSFLGQREALLAEMRMLTRELERERLISTSLRSQLQHQHSFPRQLPDHSGLGDSSKVVAEKQEVVMLREKLNKLEQKLNFEQQRSDLWERLYIEAKDENGKQETEGTRRGARGQHRAKRKPKETFLGTVKETFDAMKNSTKEFVRHHKEKIKQAKEAVKENLKKFSDSVKTTFRHFKDTTKNIFDEKINKKFGDMKEAAEKPRTVFGEFWHPQHKASPQNQGSRGPSPSRDRGRAKASHFEEFRKNADPQKGSAERDGRQSCPTFRTVRSSAVECAQQGPVSPFHLVSHVKIDEFRQLIQRYLLQELGTFHHWEDLDQFISKFFLNGVFKHDQKLFTEFVNDVKDYLKDLKEYHVDNDGVLEKLDGYIYRHFGHTFPLPYGPSQPDKKQRMVNIENSRHRKQEPKRLQPQPYKREGKWHKHSRANGRHMASLEIELGQLPFDPKY